MHTQRSITQTHWSSSYSSFSRRIHCISIEFVWRALWHCAIRSAFTLDSSTHEKIQRQRIEIRRQRTRKIRVKQQIAEKKWKKGEREKEIRLKFRPRSWLWFEYCSDLSPYKKAILHSWLSFLAKRIECLIHFRCHDLLDLMNSKRERFVLHVIVSSNFPPTPSSLYGRSCGFIEFQWCKRLVAFN